MPFRVLAIGLALALLPAVGFAQEPPACGGRDLVAELRTKEPARYQAVRAEADRTPNGKGVFFQVVKPGLAPSHLFGTVHVTDPRVLPIPAPVEEAVKRARVLLVESAEAVEDDPTTLLGPALADLAVFKDGRTLDDVIGEENKPLVREAIQRFGVPYALVRGLKPWMVMIMMALPPCETARNRAKLKVLDAVVIDTARGAGVPVESLETVEEQIGAMASISEKGQRELLIETARIADAVEDGFATMLALWQARDIGMILPFYVDLVRARTGTASEVAWDDFQRELLTKRNRVMVERALPHLAKGGAMIAVGALHLSGDEGLVELIRRAGYEVRRLD